MRCGTRLPQDLEGCWEYKANRPTQCGKPCHKPAMGMVQMAVLTHPHLKKKDRADLEHPTDIATAAMEETLKACGGQLQ